MTIARVLAMKEFEFQERVYLRPSNFSTNFKNSVILIIDSFRKVMRHLVSGEQDFTGGRFETDLNYSNWFGTDFGEFKLVWN